VQACRRLVKAEFVTLRLKLLKITARVGELASRVRLAFAAACPEADLFASLPAVLMPVGPERRARGSFRLSHPSIASKVRSSKRRKTERKTVSVLNPGETNVPTSRPRRSG